jgi:hypothetical protein
MEVDHMKRLIQTLPILVLLALVTACASAPSEVEAPAEPGELIEIPSLGSTAQLPQLIATSDGGLLLVWTARGDDGVDVFGARAEGDTYTAPVRINGAVGSVNVITIDEMRPALATAPGGLMAVAWTDTEYDIQVAISNDDGTTFDAPFRLNQDEGEALQEFPSIAFDDNGILHAAWLDPRIAEDGLEEPADLYYARVENGVISEQNLTANQESSVCGCCLPDVQIDADNIVVTFRNTTADGYRDPFQVHGTVAGDFDAPNAVTAPVWQINACPVSGPIGIGDQVLWIDGSLGTRRLLESQGDGNPPKVVLEDTDDWFLDYPPRRITGTAPDSLMLLLPAVPAYILRRDGDEWTVLADDLPPWVLSAAQVGDELVMVGTTGDNFVQARRSFP